MARSRLAKRLVGGIVAVASVAGLALPSCGVMSTGDCTDKATCSAPDVTEAALAEDVNVEPGDDSTDADAMSNGDSSDEDTNVDECSLNAENCSNVIDDNCNGWMDCAHPQCDNSSSCALKPGGWLGPIALWQGSPDAGAPPSCPPGYDTPLDWTGDLIAPPRTCSCVCSASGEQCLATTGKFSADTNCAQSCSTVSVATTCTALPAGTSTCGLNFSLNADPPLPTGGACTGLVSASPPLKATWSTAARTCSVVGSEAAAECAPPNGQCVPTPTAPYGSRACVYQIVPVGEVRPHQCPAGFATTPIVLYAPGVPIVESRNCSMCTCKGPSGGSCAGTIQIFGGTTCSGPSTQYALGSGCKPETLTGSPMPSHVQGSYVLSPGSCTLLADTVPIGMAQPNGPATVVCCM